MDIYEKIDSIFSGEAENKPVWANDILSELKEIKILLQNQSKLLQTQQTTSNSNQDFYNFVNKFRLSMKADTVKNIYPTFYYNDRKLGIDFKGLLYDKKTLHILPRDEAFKVYRYAYEQQQNKYNKVLNSA